MSCLSLIPCCLWPAFLLVWNGRENSMVWLDMVKWRRSERSFVDILVGLDCEDILNKVVWVFIFKVPKCCKGMAARKPSILPFSAVTCLVRNINCVCLPAGFAPLHKCDTFSTVLRLDV